MHFLEPKTFLLITFALFIHSSNGADPIWSDCFDSGNYTSGSQFETNLNQLLRSLAADGPRDGFYNSTVGGNSDRVYGLVQCRGDVSSNDCATCLNTSSSEIIQSCQKKKEGAIRYDYCLLRYSNESFFSVPSDPKLFLVNNQNVTSPSRFNILLGDLMNNLSNQAVFDPSKLMFATGDTNFTAFQNIYGLVQCTRDLSRNDCNRCLQIAVSYIPSCCGGKQGGQVLGPSCNIRYEVYPFVQSLPPPPPPPPPPPGSNRNSPPPRQTSVDSNTTNKSNGKG